MLIPLVHGEPIRFGPDGEHGVVLRHGRARVVDVADGRRGRPPRARRAPRRPEHSPSPCPASPAGPYEPTPIGVFRAVEAPEYAEEISRQIVAGSERQQGPGDLAALLRSGAVWEVGSNGSIGTNGAGVGSHPTE